MNLASTAVMITAWRRPHYLKDTLSSWLNARGIGDVHSFTVALGYDKGAFLPQLNVIDAARRESGLGRRMRVKPDSTAARASNGMGRAIGEAISQILAADPAVEFVICGEEDIVVSDDTLEYFAWAAERFREDGQVLAVNGHDVGGQGWDIPGVGAQNTDADQYAATLKPYYNPWLWGTWRYRWTKVLEPAWDYEVNSGGALDSGHDWNVATRIIPRSSYLCVTPDASRSQNIGKDGGWAADPAKFDQTLTASFLEHREPGEYRLMAPGARSAA